MRFEGYPDQDRFFQAWNAVRIVRDVSYSLFTFGDSDLDYFLVCPPAPSESLVSVRRGTVKVSRPMIITPDNDGPEFENFFQDGEEESIARHVIARTASFSNLKFVNHSQQSQLVSDEVEEVVAKLNRQFDEEEEDRIAILTAPPQLAGVAVLRYALEQVWSSLPGNLQELRERGFLPRLS